MKAIKDCEWIVEIKHWRAPRWYWVANTFDNTGTAKLLSQNTSAVGYSNSEDEAKENWIDFAKINGITNYKFN